MTVLQAAGALLVGTGGLLLVFFVFDIFPVLIADRLFPSVLSKRAHEVLADLQGAHQLGEALRKEEGTVALSNGKQYRLRTAPSYLEYAERQRRLERARERGRTEHIGS